MLKMSTGSKIKDLYPIGNFRFFPRLFSFFFRNFKMIIYVPRNGYCMIQQTRLWSTRLSTLKEEEKKAYVWTFRSVNNTMKYIVHQSSKIWSYLQKYYTNNGILCVKRVENSLSGGGAKVSDEEGTNKILDRGDMPWFGGCTTWWAWSPNPHTPDIGQHWSNLLLDSRSFCQVGGVHRSDIVLLCSFLNCHQSMGRGRGGGS